MSATAVRAFRRQVFGEQTFAVCFAIGAIGAVSVAVASVVVGTYPLSFSHVLPTWMGYALFAGGTVLLVSAWLVLGLSVLSPDAPRGSTLVRFAALWAAPFALTPPLFSRDVFSYGAQGRLATLGLNPYRYAPDHLGPGSYLHAVGRLWWHSHAPYGPLFIEIERLIVSVAPNALGAAYGSRLVALGGVALLARFLPRLARAHGIDERFALWLGLLNPLVLFHFVSGAHNDALMLGLVVAGLVVAGEGRPVLGLLLCTLAAAIKAPACLGAVYVAADWVLSCTGRRERQRAVLSAAAVSLGTFAVVTEVVGFGWGWIGALGTPGKVRSLLSPTTAFGTILARTISLLDHRVNAVWAITAFRVGGVIVAVLALPVLFALRKSVGSSRMLAVSLLLIVLLGPVVQPWYVLWGVVILAAVGPGRLFPAAVWASVCLPFLVLPDGTAASDVVLLLFLVSATLVVLLTLPTNTWAPAGLTDVPVTP